MSSYHHVLQEDDPPNPTVTLTKESTLQWLLYHPYNPFGCMFNSCRPKEFYMEQVNIEFEHQNTIIKDLVTQRVVLEDEITKLEGYLKGQLYHHQEQKKEIPPTIRLQLADIFHQIKIKKDHLKYDIEELNKREQILHRYKEINLTPRLKNDEIKLEVLCKRAGLEIPPQSDLYLTNDDWKVYEEEVSKEYIKQQNIQRMKQQKEQEAQKDREKLMVIERERKNDKKQRAQLKEMENELRNIGKYEEYANDQDEDSEEEESEDDLENPREQEEKHQPSSSRIHPKEMLHSFNQISRD
jgi:hypothetical protein